MREFRFTSGGVRLFALEEGTGPPIVMLHGGMADHRAVRPLVGSLATRHRLITPDLRGSGRSWYGEPLHFDLLADDVAALLDHLGEERAVVGGVSAGAGVAVRAALRHGARVAALVVARPVHGGARSGYTEEQSRAFGAMNALASRAGEEGVSVLRPLYADLPRPVRDKALAMIEGFDPASVVATSSFIAGGAQPFSAAEDLHAITAPALLVRGDDPLHPAAVSDVYATHLRGCRVLPASTSDLAAGIADFCRAISAL